MPQIHILPKSVYQLIAAGEVVERPASAIKEMVENSIDAGATRITVEIQHGGSTYMRITDDGCGIARADVPKVFISHATSKIATEEDLNAIGTLGFRGEAMASIGAVAQVELLTRTAEEQVGTRYVIAGGQEQSCDDAGCPVGTTVVVRDLFFNTPARMKFLKKDVTEGNAVAGVLDAVALSHPEIAFRLIRDGKQTLVTPGNKDLKSTVYSVFGRELTQSLIPVHYSYNGMELEGYVSSPHASRKSRAMQYFFINGRLVKSKTALAALEQAYKNSIMVGRFPACVLNMTVNTALVDVNVHPAKIEVRFARENDIFDVVYHAVKLALAQPGTGERHFTFEETKTNEKSKIEVSDRESLKNAVKKNNFTGLSAIIPGQADPGTLPPQPTPAPAVPVKPATKTSAPAAPEKPTAAAQPRWKQSSVDADILDPFVTLHSPAAPQEKPAEPFRAAASETQLDVEPDFGETKVQAGQNHMAAWDPQPAVPVKEPEKPAAPVQPAREEPEAAAEEPVEPEQMNFAPADGPEPLRYVGEVFRTYILAERGDELCLIDKHAAHERQLYEKLAANYGNVPSQMLLEPTAIDLSAEEKQALLDHVPLLENAGLEIADFGGNTVVLRAVPADVEPQNAESLLIEIANKLLKGGHDALNEHTEWVLHSISCRAAIKAGDKSSPQELLALAEKILSGEVPPFCPHGRPCVLKLTRKELEKQFGRIV